MAKTVITFGTFDVLHVGHVRVLNRAAEFGDRLVVGVSSDALNFSKKGRNPVFSQDERVELVSNMKVVDGTSSPSLPSSLTGRTSPTTTASPRIRSESSTWPTSAGPRRATSGMRIAKPTPMTVAM